MSAGGGGGSKTQFKTFDPTYRENQYQWNTPGQDTISELARMIGEQSGYNFGQRGLSGSGIQSEDIIKRLTQAAMQATQFTPTGQWMAPTVATGQKTEPGWKVGVGI